MFQGACAGFSTVGYKTESCKEEDVDEASEVHGDDGSQQSGELITTDSSLKRTGHSSCLSKYLEFSKSSSNNTSLLHLNISVNTEK